MKRALILIGVFSLIIFNCSKKTTTNNYYYSYPSQESAIVGIVHPPESMATVTAYMALPVASTQIDTNGYFKISGLPDGTYSLLVQADVYDDYSTKPYIQLSGHETAVVDTIYLRSIHDLVASVYPSDGQQDVNTGDRIRIAFRREMNRESIEAALDIEPGMEGEFSWSPKGGSGYEQLQFIPEQRWATNTLYRVSIDTSASDTAGIKLSEPYRFSFTIEPIQIEYTNPGHDATGVSPNATIYVRFNTDMNIESVNSAFQMVDSELNDVPGSFAWSGLEYLTFRPGSALIPNETFTVTIDTTASDAHGSRMTDRYQFSFTTESVGIEYTSPSHNETWVSPNVTIQIYFNTPMDMESANSAFQMVDSGLNEVQGDFVWPSYDRIEFSPTSPLAVKETYTVTIDTTASDTYGARLSAPYQFSFTTQPILISSTSPNNKQTWVSPGTVVRITFNTDMDMESVDSALQMVDSELKEVNGAFAWIYPHYLEFVPDALLANDEVYTVTIGTDAKDRYGDTLDNPFSFWFKTQP
jgi:hypothetical protein